MMQLQPVAEAHNHAAEYRSKWRAGCAVRGV